jgi:hypothetical protein
MEGSMIFSQKNILELPELLWGLQKEMLTNNVGQSDIVNPHTNILNKVYSVKRVFHYIGTDIKPWACTVTAVIVALS